MPETAFKIGDRVRLDMDAFRAEFGDDVRDLHLPAKPHKLRGVIIGFDPEDPECVMCRVRFGHFFRTERDVPTYMLRPA